MDDTFLTTARESLTAARATPRRQAAVTAALDALERALALLDAARRPRPIPLVSPLTPPTTRLDMIPRQEHVKRALEVALVGSHTVTLIAEGDPGDAFALAGWLNAYQPDTARVVRPCPCGNKGSDRAVCHCSADARLAYQAQPEIVQALLADLIITVPNIMAFPDTRGEPDERVQERVASARRRTVAEERVDPDQRPFVSTLHDSAATSLLKAAIRQLPMSGTRIRQMLAVAGSIAKLADAPQIGAAHLAEAFVYRPRWDEA